MHALAPDDEYVPVVQLEQDEDEDDPVMSEYLPDTHKIQAVAPVLERKVPTPQ